MRMGEKSDISGGKANYVFGRGGDYPRGKQSQVLRGNMSRECKLAEGGGRKNFTLTS